MNLNSNDSLFIKKIKALNYQDLLIFCIPFFIFLYYLHIFDPGLVGYDSFNQLHQIATGRFDNWHPFFHTFIEMLCLKVYSNTVSVAFFQIFVFSTLWTVICKYHRFDDQKISKVFILQVVITLLISLIPINAIYSITLIKDILYSYCILFLCFLVKVIIDKESQVSFPFIILISLVMAFIAELRVNGIFVIIPFLIILSIYLYKKNEVYRWYIFIPALTIVFILLIASLNVVYDVQENQNDALRDKVTHMLADYDLNLELDSYDKDKLHEMMAEKDIKENYEITYVDPMRNKVVNDDVWQKDKFTYISMAIKYSFKNPLHFIGYLFGSAPLTWDITRDDSWAGPSAEIYFTDIDSKRESFYEVHDKAHPMTNFDNASATNVGTAEYESLNSFVNYVKDNIILDTLFDSPALYMYLSIIILALLHFITKSRDIWLVYLPNALNIFVIFLSIFAQANRFLYSNLLVFYLLIIILINVLFKEKIVT